MFNELSKLEKIILLILYKNESSALPMTEEKVLKSGLLMKSDSELEEIRQKLVAERTVSNLIKNNNPINWN